MKKIKLPLSLRMVRGGIGKKFVIKHYAHGIVQTKFPDMSQIVPSEQQRACRSAFKNAVAAAKEIFDDPAQKAWWERKLQCRRRLFNGIVQYLMKAATSKQTVAAVQTRRLIINCFKHGADTSSLPSMYPEPKSHLPLPVTVSRGSNLSQHVPSVIEVCFQGHPG
jgi:hypothetical protein